MTDISVEMIGISKRFGKIQALDKVNFAAPSGEITSVVGENGAGKSTLMKILYGMSKPDTGEIRLNGKTVKINSTSDAIKHGIGMVHQHFMLADGLTAFENIIIGDERTGKSGLIKFKSLRHEIRSLMKVTGLEIDLDVRTEDLPVGVQQKIEIIKLLYRDSRILILDEPTAVLTPQEVNEFFSSLRKLAESGKTVILITHKIDEVLSVSNSVTVLKRGKVIASYSSESLTRETLASALSGEKIHTTRLEKKNHSCEVLLDVKDLSVTNDRGVTVINGISFEVKKGEILGIAGVEGNGQTELMEALCGIRKYQGEIKINGEKPNTSQIAHIPADRLKEGIVKEFSVEENILLGRHRERKFSEHYRINFRTLRKFTKFIIEEYDVNPPYPESLITGLSGGNQQKVVAGRELTKDSTLIIASQPTRGLDINATEFIHNRLIIEASKAKAVIIISSDLDELLKLSHRIAVLYRGSFSAILESSETNEQEIGLYMTGLK
ncbi:MAG: ABC transporter ATP-binding protein [Ignavibacteria bacterium]|nr:ABC transporter ATP-binding protein [Ignavibacteria bacterium]